VAEATRLAALESALAAREARMLDLETRARASREEIAARRQSRLTLLEDIHGEAALERQALSEGRASQRQLVAMLRRLEPAGPLREGFASNKGRLPWPAAGTLSRSFGAHVESAFESTTLSTGIDIRAPLGSSVLAIFPATVAYVDWLTGFGQLLILDHGDGFHSVMAHLASVLVKVGDRVDQGQVVGTVGDTGSLRGTVLYFEIRQDGLARDPAEWLRR
jgi:murein DD-endopeptidase MepM/ murein hydrolase activator NlpD